MFYHTFLLVDGTATLEKAMVQEGEGREGKKATVGGLTARYYYGFCATETGKAEMEKNSGSWG
jgi:hypothetical protein